MLTAAETAAVNAVDGDGALALLSALVRAKSVWPTDMEDEAARVAARYLDATGHEPNEYAELSEVLRCTRVMAVSAMRTCGAAR